MAQTNDDGRGTRRSVRGTCSQRWAGPFIAPFNRPSRLPPTVVFLGTGPACSHSSLHWRQRSSLRSVATHLHSCPQSGREGRRGQGSPALIFTDVSQTAGPAGGDSGTTPRPPSLRARDPPALLWSAPDSQTHITRRPVAGSLLLSSDWKSSANLVIRMVLCAGRLS